MPISRDRRATAAYIVLVAANALPTAMITATANPSTSSGAPELVIAA